MTTVDPERVKAAAERAEKIKQGVVERPERSLVFTPASAFEDEATMWVWEQRIPLGELTLIAGREGTGKSTLAVNLAAQLSHGNLEGDLHGKQLGTIICATEDTWRRTINPRLRANDADMDRIFEATVQTADGYGGGQLVLPLDNEQLEKRIGVGDIGFLILDPLMSRLDSRLNSNQDQEVRLALEPLVALCQKNDVSILGLIHVNKGKGTDALTRIMASRAFPAVARSVLYVMEHPEDDSIKVVGIPKNNLATTDKSTLTLTYTIEGVTTGFDTKRKKDIVGSQVVWGDALDITIDDLLQQSESKKAEKESPRDRAKEWLKTFLLGEPEHRAMSAVCKDKANREEKIAEATLVRAANELGIKITGQGRFTSWGLNEGPAMLIDLTSKPADD